MLIRSQLRYLIADYEERTGRRLSLSRLARETGLAESTLRNLLNNTTQRFDGPVLAALCTYFQVPIEKLLVYEPEGVLPKMTYQLPESAEQALNQLEGFYTDVIRSIKADEFTSHEFILELAHLRQQDYISYLTCYVNNTSPFQVVHGQLAQSLHKFPELVTLVNPKVASRDIFNHDGFAALWRKVN